MFDLVQKNKTAVQVVLGLVSLGLVVGVGVGGYSAFQDGENFLAKVDGVRITEREYAEATKKQPVPDDMKPMVIDELVQRQLLLNEAQSLHMTVTAANLRELIAADKSFQTDGKFDPALYKDFLSKRGITAEDFEREQAENLSQWRLVGAIVQSGMISGATQERMKKILGERREVQLAKVGAEEFLKAVTVSDVEIKQYYDGHAAEFKVPEQVKLEYVLFTPADMPAMQLSDAEVQKYYDEHKQEISKEERKARHILLLAPQDATPAQKAELKKQAEALLAEIKQAPARFADVAKLKSQDPASAKNGGELDWYGRGAGLVKSFEDAMFALSKGQISNVIESQYGFHIIKLDDVRTKTLADARPEIEERLKSQKMQTAFQAQAEKFNDMVYQQADSLKPAADAFKLQIRKSDWFGREGGKERELASPKIVEAAFSDDVLKKKHNSEAIEVAPGALVAVRVVEHKPEQVSPLAEANSKIAEKLRFEKAVKKAQEEGALRLKALQSGQNPQLKWEASQEVMRGGRQQIQDAQLKEIFRAQTDKLPGYVGGEQKDQGFVIYKVVKVTPAEAPVTEVLQNMTMATLNHYLESLRKAAKVEIKPLASKRD